MPNENNTPRNPEDLTLDQSSSTRTQNQFPKSGKIIDDQTFLLALSKAAEDEPSQPARRFTGRSAAASTQTDPEPEKINKGTLAADGPGHKSAIDAFLSPSSNDCEAKPESAIGVFIKDNKPELKRAFDAISIWLDVEQNKESAPKKESALETITSYLANTPNEADSALAAIRSEISLGEIHAVIDLFEEQFSSKKILEQEPSYQELKRQIKALKIFSNYEDGSQKTTSAEEVISQEDTQRAFKWLSSLEETPGKSPKNTGAKSATSNPGQNQGRPSK